VRDRERERESEREREERERERWVFFHGAEIEREPRRLGDVTVPRVTME